MKNSARATIRFARGQPRARRIRKSASSASGRPVAFLLLPEPQAVPAMSRCAHFSPLVKRPRKAAAVMAPPSRPATLATSAKLVLSCSPYSSVSGSCQARAQVKGGQYRGRAAHVVLHLVHGVRVFQRNAAAVERDALADQYDRCATAPAPAMLEDQEARRFGTALRHGKKTAHL